MRTFMKIVILVITLVTPFMAQQPFKFEVDILKNTFLVGEPIVIGLSILNTSKLVQPKPGGISIKLVDDTGVPLSHTGPSGDWFSPSENDIKPGQECYRIIEINKFWGIRFCRSSLSHRIDAGKYTLEVFYSQPGFPLQTINLPIQIAAPDGDEKFVWNSMLELCENEVNLGTKEFTEKLSSLHVKYPNSVYTPIMLVTLEALYGIVLKDQMKATAARKELIEEHLWSSDAPSLLWGVLYTMPSKVERVDYLKKLLPKSKNSLAQKQIERKLKEELER
ncbi:MAG: hypothetical protein COZ25_03215 [Ignavibacteria bacterium CG_4_10_14_3_um_filter_37_18]|nr:MAG: hypothetical protein COZ25_03215 [Ignavibacteria bacterium CG_4_10_14_3_um_filter_37_18]